MPLTAMVYKEFQFFETQAKKQGPEASKKKTSLLENLMENLNFFKLPKSINNIRV